MSSIITFSDDSTYLKISDDLIRIFTPFAVMTDTITDTACAAAILQHFIGWTDYRRRNGLDGWVRMSHTDIADGIRHIAGSAKIKTHLDAMLKIGVLSRRENPGYKTDRTYQYCVNAELVQGLVDGMVLPEITTPTREKENWSVVFVDWRPEKEASSREKMPSQPQNAASSPEKAASKQQIQTKLLNKESNNQYNQQSNNAPAGHDVVDELNDSDSGEYEIVSPEQTMTTNDADDATATAAKEAWQTPVYDLLIDAGISRSVAKQYADADVDWIERLLAYAQKMLADGKIRSSVQAFVVGMLKRGDDVPDVSAGTDYSDYNTPSAYSLLCDPDDDETEDDYVLLPAAGVAVEGHSMTTDSIWNAAYSQLELQLDTHNFNTYLKGATYRGYADGTYTIGVRSSHAQAMLQTRLYRNIQAVLKHTHGADVAIQFESVRPQPELSPLMAPGARMEVAGG